jgi:hypothetical protein
MDWRETTYSGSPCKQKNLTQTFGIYKNYSKKRFLDSMDLRETTLFLLPCKQKSHANLGNL